MNQICLGLWFINKLEWKIKSIYWSIIKSFPNTDLKVRKLMFNNFTLWCSWWCFIVLSDFFNALVLFWLHGSGQSLYGDGVWGNDRSRDAAEVCKPATLLPGPKSNAKAKCFLETPLTQSRQQEWCPILKEEHYLQEVEQTKGKISDNETCTSNSAMVQIIQGIVNANGEPEASQRKRMCTPLSE